MSAFPAVKPLVAVLVLAAALAGCTGRTETVPQSLPPGGFSSTNVFAPAFDLTGNWSRVLEPGPYGIGAPEIVRLKSQHDGIEFPLALVLPRVPDGQRVPVLVEFSPYWPDMTDPKAFLASPSVHFAREFLVGNFAPHGYAVALVATRGTSNAGGCIEALGPGERADVDQTLTWLATQPWSTGRIGAIGHSQSGANAWLAAATANPHLATIVANAAYVDLFHIAFRNGTNGLFGTPILPLFHVQAAATRTGLHPEHAMCPVVAESIAWSATGAVTGTRDPAGFWTARDLRPLIKERYRGSVLAVHGLQDWLVTPSAEYPWLNELAASGVTVKQLLGQWEHKYPDWNAAHDPASRWDWAEILLHWFDFWLREDATRDLGPVAQVQDSLGWWRSESGWPPADAQARTFYLAPDGRLGDGPGNGAASVPVGPTLDYFPQPLQRPARADAVSAFPCLGCPRFSTQRLETELRFAGAPRVPVTITPGGPGGVLAGHLYVIYPAAWYGAGQVPVIERLTSGMIDLRFADGGESAAPVVLGRSLTVRLQLEPVDAVIPAGGRLVLELVEGAYGERLPGAPNYPMWVEVGGDRSRLEVKTFDRGAGSFFRPPGASP